MNNPDNFLSRWSRRKRHAVDAQLEKTSGGQASVEPTPAGEQKQSKPASAPSKPGAPEFDVSSLPPIDSIGPGTDLSAFMQSDVPLALRHAALRRAWSADPAIRDFMGPTENYWDAVGPDGIPGFGDLDPGLDVKRMVSELFGEKAPEAPESPPVTTDKSAEIIEDTQAPKSAHAPVPTEETHSQGTENGASQKQSPQTQPERKIARRHGGATPE
jgi:hypothetical protein